LTLAELEARLRLALARELPGPQAQVRMAPRPRPGWRARELPDGTREAAGLLLLYPFEGQPCVLLTVRAGVLARHGGQVSLPGGVIEPGETVADAAVREAVEEVAVDPREVRIVGALTPLHIPVSGFTLHPEVAVTDRRPEFRHAAEEVARILEVPLQYLVDGSRVRVGRHTRGGVDYDIPYFDVHGEQVWGATAMILAEFLSILGAAPDPWGGNDVGPD
jgi:8-oxo-dGTP pyrophosphatase MutT (NUDIX family)